jgi:5-hydroxyisourate hydrolase-like protein (transthyretin family)
MSRPPLARLGLAALAVVLTTTGYATPASAAPAAAAETGTIQGTLIGGDGTPTTFAQVTVYAAETSEHLADALTDAAGRFTVDNAAAGTVKLKFHAAGLDQWAHQRRDFDSATILTVLSGQTLTVDEQMLPTGTIYGRFTTADGSSPGYTAVYAQDADTYSVVYGVSDEDGQYSIDVLPGRYKIAFELGSGTQFAYQAASFETATAFTVKAGATVQVDDSRLSTGSLGGRLTTASGAPASDSRVTLQTPDTFAGTTTTDENGDYSFASVLPGDYQVSFTTGESTQWAYGTTEQSNATTITVSAGERSLVNDKLLSTGSLAGRFTDADGNGIGGWSVNAQLDVEGHNGTYSATTDASGRWTIGNAYPGVYLVSFHDPRTGRTQYAYGKGNRTDASRITVAADATTNVNDTSVPAAQLTVTARDGSSGTALSTFCVYAAGPTNGNGCTTTGTVTIPDLPAGPFSISVTAEEDSFYLPGGITATTVAGQTVAVSVPLTLGGRISTTAADRNTGTPVADACIAAVLPRTGGLPSEGGTCTDSTGTVTSERLAPGVYQLFAYAPRRSEFGHQWVARTGGTGDQQAAATVVVKPGTVSAAPAILLDKAGTITGTVTDFRGIPVADGLVSFSAWGFLTGESHEVSIDAAGRYTMTGLGPYAWPLAFTTDELYREWSGNTGNRFAAYRIPVRAGSTTNYDMALRAGTTLAGTVTVGRGVQGRIIAVNPMTGDSITANDFIDDGAYSMRVPGAEPIKIQYYLWGTASSNGGWYDNVTEMAKAKKVAVPKSGTKTFDFSIR